MTQVNMLEAKTELSKLVRLLESREQDYILIARNGVPVVQMTLFEPHPAGKRIGAAEGVFAVPDEWDEWDAEIADAFEDP